jgi:hypothetical protein
MITYCTFYCQVVDMVNKFQEGLATDYRVNDNALVDDVVGVIEIK